MQDYERLYGDYVVAQARYRRSIPGKQEYEEAKREVAIAGRKLAEFALARGIKPIGGPAAELEPAQVA